MKKLLTFLLTAVMLLSLMAGCAKPVETAAEPAAAPAETAAEAAPEAAAEAPAEAPAEKRTIVVGLMSGYQPYEYQNEDGSYDGFDVAVISEAISRLGYDVEFLMVEWSALLTSLDAGKCDVVSTQLARTEERAGLYNMATVPYFEGGGQFIVRADSDITGMADFEGSEHSIGTTVGDAWTTLLEDYNTAAAADKQLKLVYYQEDIATVIADIANGRIDGTLNEPNVAWLKVVAQGLDKDLKVVGDLEGNYFAYTAFQKSDAGAALRAEFDAVYKQMLEDGTIAKICMEWFNGNDYTGNLMANIVPED